MAWWNSLSILSKFVVFIVVAIVLAGASANRTAGSQGSGFFKLGLIAAVAALAWLMRRHLLDYFQS